MKYLNEIGLQTLINKIKSEINSLDERIDALSYLDISSNEKFSIISNVQPTRTLVNKWIFNGSSASLTDTVNGNLATCGNNANLSSSADALKITYGDAYPYLSDYVLFSNIICNWGTEVEVDIKYQEASYDDWNSTRSGYLFGFSTAENPTMSTEYGLVHTGTVQSPDGKYGWRLAVGGNLSKSNIIEDDSSTINRFNEKTLTFKIGTDGYLSVLEAGTEILKSTTTVPNDNTLKNFILGSSNSTTFCEFHVSGVRIYKWNN